MTATFLPPYEQNDFSGGFTDNRFGSDPTKCFYNDNCVVDTNRKLLQRPGSVIDGVGTYQLPAVTTRVGRLMKFIDESKRFGVNARSLYYDSSGAWVELTGPTGNHAFAAAVGINNRISYSEWQGHLLAADDAGGQPVKIYKDGTSVWQVRTAGLPFIASPQNYVNATILANAITLANDLKTKFLAHIDDYAISYNVTTTAGNKDLTNPVFQKTSPLVTTTGVLANMYVRVLSGGAYIPAGTKVASITAGVKVTTDTNSVGSGAITVLFNPVNSSSYFHSFLDSTARALFSAVTNASDLPTLLTLANALAKAYTSHISDAMILPALGPFRLYHMEYYGLRGGPNIPLLGSNYDTNASTTNSTMVAPPSVTTLVEACALLDDIKQKYNWHDAAQYTHDISGILANHQVTATSVGPTDSGIRVSQNLTELLSYANNLKAAINAHFARGPAYIHVIGDPRPITTANATDLSTLVTLIADIQRAYRDHYSDAAFGAPALHFAQDATSGMVPDAIVGDIPTDTTDLAALATKLETILTAYNAHNSSAVAHNATGQDLDFQITPVIGSYTYGFCHRYDYTVGTVSFTDRGPMTFVGPVKSCVSNTSGASITQIPVLANTSDQNYATATIQIEAYRTVDGGDTYYLAKTITNGTTSMTEGAFDSDLQSNEPLYTTGGVVENDPPPVAKYVHIVNSTGYYGNIVDTGEALKNRIRQSVQGDFDSVPGDFFVDLDDEVMGISSARTIPVAFSRTGVFRIEGAFDELGRGSMSAVSIYNPDGIGLLSENSIVRIESGILFAGTNGFYFTDGYQLIPISSEWKNLYRTVIGVMGATVNRITGTYDKNANRAFWAMQRSATSADNDVLYCLDLTHGFPAKQCWSSLSNGTHFAPTALLFWNNQLLRGDRRGYLFKHDEAYLDDPYVNTTLVPTSWGTSTIRTDYITQTTDLGMGSMRKFGAWLSLNFKNEGNLTQALTSTNDDGGDTQAMGPIKMWTSFLWGDPLAPAWGTPGIFWNYTGSYYFKRRFVSKKLRFTYKQIEITNNLIELASSSTVPGPATVNAATKNIVLDDGTQSWLGACEGYFIRLATDSYATSYEILQRVSDTTIKVLDPGGTLTNGSVAWQLWGYPKHEKFHLLSWAIHAVPLSMSQLASRSGADS